jgi:hypothetical protein
MADERSEYARLYGTTGDEFLGDNKSGLTPITDIPDASTSEFMIHLSRTRRYQTKYLQGFETRLLHVAHALTDTGIGRSDLSLIHPILQRDRWETELPRHMAFYPLPHGKTGFWVASNDDVWEALAPCLAFATQLIDHFHLWQWLDLTEHIAFRFLTYCIGGILSYSAAEKKSIRS